MIFKHTENSGFPDTQEFHELCTYTMVLKWYSKALAESLEIGCAQALQNLETRFPSGAKRSSPSVRCLEAIVASSNNGVRLTG